MNGSSSMMYHGNRAFGSPTPLFMMPGQYERMAPTHYPLELLQYMGAGVRNGNTIKSGQSTTRRSQQRRDQQTIKNNDSVAFGYDSDDSSLSSNASGSAKSSEKGDNTSRSSDNSSNGSFGGNAGNSSVNINNSSSREWRARGLQHHRRDHHQTRGSKRIAPERYLNASYPFQVKYTPDDLLNGSKYDTLSQEIWDKFVMSQQKEETFKQKMNLWKYLYITIKAIFPRYGLYVVGSTMSGFGLDSSDMDLCLYVRPVECVEPRSHALVHLSFILNYIRSLDPGAELIQAKVPILKFKDSRYSLQVDLNCNNVVGIRNTNLLYCYSRLDWRVRPLVVITKLWAQAHNINDARQRTLASYSLTLMVLQYLQFGASPPVLPCLYVRWNAWDGAPHPRWMPQHHRSQNRQPLGELFLGFLHYYSIFQYDKMAVSVRAGHPVPVSECRVAKSHKNDPHQWKLLCVEEPFDLTNTARSVYDPETFEKIIDTFKESYRKLSSGYRLADAWPASVR